MLELIDLILSRVAVGEPVALCTLVRARGSTPQASGAAMVVLADGNTLGTLGGGCVEAEVRARAVRAIHADAADDRARDALASFKLDHDYGWDDGLMCGGMMDVAVQTFRSAADAAALGRLRDALRSRSAASYAVTLPDEQGRPRAFEVRFEPTPTLLIAGAGHVGQAIAALAATLDFDVVVFDDRADVATAERFPATRRVVGAVDVELARFAVTPHTYVVIVTRGHRHDASALAAVVNGPAAYVGMIGSKRKVRTILGGLATEGVAREQLLRVHAPIGLEIGAVTPGEIAVSVCAELIAVRRAQVGAGVALKIGEDELTRWLDHGESSARDAVPDAG